MKGSVGASTSMQRGTQASDLLLNIAFNAKQKDKKEKAIVEQKQLSPKGSRKRKSDRQTKNEIYLQIRSLNDFHYWNMKMLTDYFGFSYSRVKSILDYGVAFELIPTKQNGQKIADSEVERKRTHFQTL